MLRADFHIHSTISDGSATLEEIVELSKGNVDVIAITDHDTLAHQRMLPSCKDLIVLAGIEISAIDPKTKVKAHILGYQIKDIELVERLTIPLLERRHENSLKQIEVLKSLGFLIDERKLARANHRYIYKQHIMQYLVKTHQVSEMFGEFYQNTFKHGGPCDFDIDYIDVFEAVKTIKKAGGKAVLAHSGQQQNFDLIDELVKVGLDGLEYNHHANSITDQEIIKQYADQYGLFLTGGSDYHGSNEAIKSQIGDHLSMESGVKALC